MESRKIRVLHITAHLGGGVGKALSGLVLNNPASCNIHHSIVCLERPEKSQFVDKIAGNCDIFIAPDHRQLAELIEHSDIVQLEWWNHPITIKMLCSGVFPAMRLLLWCHISGLHNPIIPANLIKSSQKCIFTSPCSYEATTVSALQPEFKDRMDVVYSAGGFEDLLLPDRLPDSPCVFGYLGSLNFAKLHPGYVDFLAAVTSIPDFKVSLIGDIHNKGILEKQCKDVGRDGMLDFRGYSSDIASQLSSINVMPYLLNPKHYGTTENALLEAMAMGVVPIVLNNPAEKCLIEERKTGLIISNPNEFAAAVTWLVENPHERIKISKQAAASVRTRFSVERMVDSLASHYADLLTEQKRDILFDTIFGNEPYEWFISCQGDSSSFCDSGLVNCSEEDYSIYGLLEQTKGTAFHFLKNFPEDLRLKKCVDQLSKMVRYDS